MTWPAIVLQVIQKQVLLDALPDYFIIFLPFDCFLLSPAHISIAVIPTATRRSHYAEIFVSIATAGCNKRSIIFMAGEKTQASPHI